MRKNIQVGFEHKGRSGHKSPVEDGKYERQRRMIRVLEEHIGTAWNGV